MFTHMHSYAAFAYGIETGSLLLHCSMSRTMNTSSLVTAAPSWLRCHRHRAWELFTKSRVPCPKLASR
jgi:hypothetical protein